MGQEVLNVVNLLVKINCWAENVRIMLTYNVKCESLYQYMMNTMKLGGNFVVKLFSVPVQCVPKG